MIGWFTVSLPIPDLPEIGNIPSSIEVSMQCKPTLNTLERITFPVTFVDMSTIRTFLTCISRVDYYNGFANSLSLIPEKLFKLVKAPVVKSSGKFNSFGSALNSYAVQILNSKNIMGHSHNFLRDTVVDFRYKPFLFSADLPEKSFSRASAFVLKFCSKVCVLCSHVFYRLAIEKFVIRGNCNVYYPSVDSKKTASRRFGGLFTNGNMKVKRILLSIIAKCRSSKFPIKILPVVFRNRKSGFHSPFNGCKCNSFLREVDVANSLVIPDSGILFALRELLKFNSFKCFTGNISDSLKDRTRQFRILTTNIIVSSVERRGTIPLRNKFRSLLTPAPQRIQ
jgi:hypothetical protein